MISQIIGYTSIALCFIGLIAMFAPSKETAYHSIEVNLIMIGVGLFAIAAAICFK